MIANNTTLSDFKKISGMNGRIYNFCSQAGIKTFDDFMSFVPSTYCGNMTYRTIAEITELQYEYKGEWERASADNRDIDREQRRYEIAKELMKGFASNPHDQCADASCETLAQWSISGADALITELKKEVNNDTEASI